MRLRRADPSPFIEREELTEILGFDVLTSDAITTYLDGLVGLIDVKPLECVGEVAEAATALQLTAIASGPACLTTRGRCSIDLLAHAG